MGKAELSSGDTNTSMAPSGDSAMWLMLISSGTARANCMRVAGAGRRAMNQVTAEPAANASAMESQRRIGVGLGAAVARAAMLVSVPEKALSANDKSRADWKR